MSFQGSHLSLAVYGDVFSAVRLNRKLNVSGRNEDCKMLIQECIEGEEDAVDSIFSMGKHTETFAAHFFKKLIRGRGKIYNHDEILDMSDPKYAQLVDYADRVCDTLGFSFGAIHNEYMIDAKGPVLPLDAFLPKQPICLSMTPSPRIELTIC